MSNAAQYAADDTQELRQTVSSAEDLLESLKNMSTCLYDISDGVHDVNEDKYERIIDSISLKGLNQRLASSANMIDECVADLRKA